MIKRCFKNWQTYLALIPMVIVIICACLLKNATTEVLIKEKYVEIINSIDSMAASLERTTNRDWQEHESNIVGAVEFFDNLTEVYGAAYKYTDGELGIITERYSESTLFDPFDYDIFIKAIHTETSGKMIIGYVPDGGRYRELHIYFRWMPLYTPELERYLVVAGVSELSIVSTIPLWLSAGYWIGIAVTVALNMWHVVQVACEDDGKRR